MNTETKNGWYVCETKTSNAITLLDIEPNWTIEEKMACVKKMLSGPNYFSIGRPVLKERVLFPWDKKEGEMK